MASHNHTGRSKREIKGPFIALPHTVVDSPGYRAATPVARAAHIAIMRRFNGSNNGSIAVPARAVADELNISRSTAARAIRSLVNCGLLRQTKASSFSLKREAAEFRLTHLKCHKTGAPPTHEYLRHRQIGGHVCADEQRPKEAYG
jgi:DNA-binding IclR family transcriptional regulator